MTVKCTFCNDTKQELGIPGPCVWCEQVGAAPVAVGYQLAKGFTDPVGDCEKFEAGITVNAWLQRIVVYGDSPADAEALRDHIMASTEREAALREELARYKSLFGQAQKAIDRLNELHPKRMGELAKRLTVAEQLLHEVRDSGDWHSSALEFIHGEGFEVLAKIEAALKPAAEGEGS